MVDALYLHIERTINPSSASDISVRDFCFPLYDPRHWGRYPPPGDRLVVWVERRVVDGADWRGRECRLRGGDRVLVDEAAVSMQEGMVVGKRATDHLPNNVFAMPISILE